MATNQFINAELRNEHKFIYTQYKYIKIMDEANIWYLVIRSWWLSSGATSHVDVLALDAWLGWWHFRYRQWGGYIHLVSVDIFFAHCLVGYIGVHVEIFIVTLVPSPKIRAVIDFISKHRSEAKEYKVNIGPSSECSYIDFQHMIIKFKKHRQYYNYKHLYYVYYIIFVTCNAMKTISFMLHLLALIR